MAALPGPSLQRLSDGHKLSRARYIPLRAYRGTNGRLSIFTRAAKTSEAPVEQQQAVWAPQAALAAAAAACLLGASPAVASELATIAAVPVPPASAAPMASTITSESLLTTQQQYSAAPSLVSSPLPGDATADLTTRAVAAALSPAASGDLGEQLQQQQQQQLVQPQALAEGLKAVVGESVQGANLAGSAMQPVVGGAVPQSWFSTTPLCNVWQAYCSCLAQAPLPTKAATSAVGTFLGDLVAQYLAHYAAPQRGRRRSSSGSSSSTGSSLGGFDYDPLRAARLVAYSALINTPMAHYWYILLDAAVLPATPTAPLAVAAKVLLDQFGQTPFGMALFFYMLKVFEGKPGQAAAEVKSKWMPALMANWCIWPAAQLVNFIFIPIDLRILYVNVISIGWTAIISNMANGDASGSASSSAAAAGESSSNTSRAAAEAAAAAGVETAVAAPAAFDGRLLQTAGVRMAVRNPRIAHHQRWQVQQARNRQAGPTILA